MKPGRELVSRVALLGAVVAALALAGILHRSPDAATRSSPSLAGAAVAALPAVAERVERIRGLRFDFLPRPQVISARRFRRLSERDARRAGATRELAAGSVVAKLLGLVPPDADLSGLAGDTAGLAAAAYDPRRGRLYVIREAVPGDRGLTEFVLAHELTHALEDQRFGLAELDEVTDDRALAELALVEGTATAVMTEYARRHLSVLDLAGSALGLDTGTGGVPDFLVEQLGFAYLRGAAFVERLHRAAGGWNVVDIALRHNLPASTEQILHPRKYLLGERPLPVALGAAPGPRWRLAGGGSIGEFATGQLLRVGLSEDAARAAAAGWGGDRYALWRRRSARLDCRSEAACRATFALEVRWRWGSATDLRQFLVAVRRYGQDGIGGRPAGRGTLRLAGGWAAVAVTDGTVSLVLAPARSLATRLATARRPRPRG
jgi:hypothetical protein